MQEIDRPRYAKHLPLPQRRYIPEQSVRTDRPDFDPILNWTLFANLEQKHWWSSEPFLFALDLFNEGYYWESHEVWEGMWHHAGRTGPIADFLKGLIKIAAAMVKRLQNQPNGIKRHSTRAIKLFQSVKEQSKTDPLPLPSNLQFDELIKIAESIRNHADESMERRYLIELDG